MSRGEVPPWVCWRAQVIRTHPPPGARARKTSSSLARECGGGRRRRCSWQVSTAAGTFQTSGIFLRRPARHTGSEQVVHHGTSPAEFSAARGRGLRPGGGFSARWRRVAGGRGVLSSPYRPGSQSHPTRATERTPHVTSERSSGRKSTPASEVGINRCRLAVLAKLHEGTAFAVG